MGPGLGMLLLALAPAEIELGGERRLKAVGLGLSMVLAGTGPLLRSNQGGKVDWKAVSPGLSIVLTGIGHLLRPNQGAKGD